MEIQIVLELRCLDVSVSSWVFEVCPMERRKPTTTNSHFFGRQPSQPDDLETCNGLSLTSTWARTPVCFHLMSRLKSRRGSVLDSHCKLRSDSRRFKQGRVSRASQYLCLVSNHVRRPRRVGRPPPPSLPFLPTTSRSHSTLSCLAHGKSLTSSTSQTQRPTSALYAPVFHFQTEA